LEARWGKCLGRYELVSELGRGAMGVVYKARDPRIDRFVALKTISLVGANEDEALEYRERFFQEAQAVGRLVHPGIVTVFDVGEEPETGTPYIVMEYVDGPSLNALLSGQGGKLPVAAALRLTEELAEALDCAHGQGVVHRDIKPANILVTSSGHAKITDFGIAKLNLAHLTLPGHVLGTPAYMSPEQLNGERVDGRSDLFSLGVILYNMVSGYRPFQGNSVTTVCFKLANHDPLPPTALDPDLPHGVDAIIMRAMAKDPAQRYQRGLEFALDVKELKDRLSNNGTKEQTAVRSSARGGPSSEAVPELIHRLSGRASEWCSGAWKKAFARLRTVSLVPARRRFATVAVIALGTVMFAWSWHRESYPTVEAHPAKGATTSPKLAPVRAITGETAPAPRAESAHAKRTTASKVKSATPAPAPTGAAMSTATQASRADTSVSHVDMSTHEATSTLVIGINYPFQDGTVSVQSDSRVIYTHALRGEPKKHLGMFKTVQGRDSGTVHLSSGEHQLRVHVQSDAYDDMKTVALNLSQGQTKTLQISFHGHQKDMRLDLR
jgi:eukaryotic-like serine/threonine-protein kinase